MSKTHRTAKIERDTSETRISIDLNLDGKSINNSLQTGFGFADHMLDLMAHWGDIELQVSCDGDIYIDAHHSLEDTAICLGQAFSRALGDRSGIARVGWAKVPMDEAMAEAVVDFSGRPYLVYQGHELLSEIIAGEEKDLWREFFKSFAFSAKMNMHIIFHYGSNSHHLLESSFKALGLAVRQAKSLTRSGVLSTKGILD
ncbi:imidazoleglycerol-phosphate dehydratase HisB [Desulfonatronovibrio magnus]|uniref:imidazoleglycerol-phosphate dehydratase HisB n=1 Tax=Desulfonatronovibrio magnus TaxID=698827 RepID=UPI0005EACAF6|nr:imidazoleglycerol-phosphate dehydratase HisB [Desulfonatronovibrio magnus]